MLFLGSALAAADLPLYARWQSRHYVYYDTLQSGKELSWDELYRAEIGIEGAKWKDCELAFAVRSEEFFDEAILKLQSFSVQYFVPQSCIWLGAGTKQHGYGTGSALDTMPVLARGYTPYRFQAMRFNGLALGVDSTSNTRWELKLGGNKHNQGSVLLSYNYHTEAIDKRQYSLSIDARAMDNHWRTPVCIPAFEYSDNWNSLYWNITAAMAYLPQWEETQQNEEYFALGDLRYITAGHTGLGIAMAHKRQSYAPIEDKEYRSYLVQDIGAFRIIPMATRQEVDSKSFDRYSILCQYKILDSSTIGAYYEYSHFGKNKPRHSMGLAVDIVLLPAK